jgi:hypothetical protein
MYSQTWSWWQTRQNFERRLKPVFDVDSINTGVENQMLIECHERREGRRKWMGDKVKGAHASSKPKTHRCPSTGGTCQQTKQCHTAQLVLTIVKYSSSLLPPKTFLTVWVVWHPNLSICLCLPTTTTIPQFISLVSFFLCDILTRRLLGDDDNCVSLWTVVCFTIVHCSLLGHSENIYVFQTLSENIYVFQTLAFTSYLFEGHCYRFDSP